MQVTPITRAALNRLEKIAPIGRRRVRRMLPHLVAGRQQWLGEIHVVRVNPETGQADLKALGVLSNQRPDRRVVTEAKPEGHRRAAEGGADVTLQAATAGDEAGRRTVAREKVRSELEAE